MKRICIILVSLLLVLVIFSFKKYENEQSDSPYKPGENFTYLIHYGFINGGKAFININNDLILDKRAYHVKIQAKTTGIADALYKVRDTYESYIDPLTDLPVKAIRNISEGRYKRYNEVLFDHESRTDSSLVYSQTSGLQVVPKNIHDILSGFYYMRKYYITDGISIGDIIHIKTYFTDELFPLSICYKGTETIRTKLGKVECYRFDPVTEVGRLFKTENDMSIWFSKDKNFIPVRIRFDIYVGSVKVDLIEFEGIKHDFESLTN